MEAKSKIRISALIKKRHPELTNTQIAKILQKGLVKSGDRVLKLRAWVPEDMEITLPPEILRTSLKPMPNLSCKTIFESDSILVVSKPHQMHSVALDTFEENSVANWLMAHKPELVQISSPLEMGLLNRLDYETKGLLVVAKTIQAYEILKDDWKLGRVQKFYSALVQNPLKPGEYDHFMGQRSKSSPKVFVRDTDMDQQWHPVSILIHSCEVKDDLYELKVQLLTGHRHQIRAQLAHLGAPIVGDDLYGGTPNPQLQLVSERVVFEDPVTKRNCDVQL